MDGLHSKTYLDVIPLGSYDILIGMDWLESHYVVLDCHNKTITCLDEENKKIIIKGIQRHVSICRISAMQVKKYFRKRCQLHLGHAEELKAGEEVRIEDYLVLQEFVDVFHEVPGLPLKRDIDFTIDLVPGTAPI